MTEIVLGLIQMDCSGSRDANVARAETLVREAAGRGANVIALPEAFHDWFFMTEMDLAHLDKAETVPGPLTRQFGALAADLSVVIVLPIFERVPHDVYYNSAIVIDADGTLLGTYRKNHIPLNPIFYEKLYFKPGNLGYPVFETRFGRIGLLICHDRHYPEGARAVALGGAEILIIPTATPRSSLSGRVWEKELAAHAIFNEFYVAGVNRVGTEKGTEYYGKSIVLDPVGDIVAQAGEGEEILIVECPRAKIIERRRAWQFYRDRRPDTYEIVTRLLP